MVKICMVVLKNYYFDARVRRYAESLIKNGVKVDVLCLQDDDPDIVTANTDNLRVFTIPLRHFQGSQARYLYEISLAFLLFTSSFWAASQEPIPSHPCA